ncbi:MAG: DUF3106 domain-containing protein [Ottowia sp.]|uniref:DUF3106 domain-containing protein n=1 Tax=Ottowia sp. TaxID=1898956 RepID=UPI0039E394A4
MRSLLPAMILACAASLTWPAHAQPVGEAAGEPASPLAGGIGWKALDAEQRNALQPLAKLWPKLHPAHQRKWIALVHNFNRMSPDEQSILQDRMAEWARLTPAQRTQARLNFGEVRRVPADEKRAKWEEYQALPAEERERLANDRPKPPVSAAPALRPTPPSRIVRPPAIAVTRPAPNDASPVVPVNRNTLLPQPAASAPRPSR